MARVVIFGPHPLLTVTIEARGAADDVHVHAGGQGVWAARMAGELGAEPVLCGFAGGETGALVQALLERLPGERRLVATAAPSGCYVTDRRSGERRLIAGAPAGAPTRHEADDLVSVTAAVALGADVLVVCNPYPADALPLDSYDALVTDGRGNGTRVIVDLSTPRLERALAGRPDLVKLNDWELAEYVYGPVDGPRLREGAERLLAAGAQRVLVTRGAEPALWLDGDDARWLVPPRFEQGSREGCGDTMVGAMAAALADGRGWDDVLRLGAAAGAANFLRHGLGTGERAVVEQLVERVELVPYSAGA
ncbi:MAG: PfkB family carbohydrate kinase [Solirubrobacteraceae bacterium]